MNVLVINCGSSSLKYQLINSDTEDVLAKGLCERIGIDGRLVYQKAGLDKEITECAMPTHKEAIQFVLDALTNEKTGAIKSLKEVDAIGHRVVHGGEKFAASAVITDVNSVHANIFGQVFIMEEVIFKEKKYLLITNLIEKENLQYAQR